MEIKLALECSECGEELKFEWQAENMLVSVHPCFPCSNNAEADVLQKFWEKILEANKKVAEFYDIL